ncbi:Transient receptor potential cation channel subfamily A member 1 [Amphibalanus amphitrite]|uniref:Transient receptor potential cation channel subfamily A member 1 n=1 Tax=Amphibalanus amphitrite TaxID=1232801 RepID=A0A6A4WU52_AMPAM|nr:Transient receptor potential cation channel subfamily A member 1 [Amphibalanus amphitrite]
MCGRGAATDCLDASLRSPFHLAVWLDRPQSLRLLAQHRRLVRAEQLTEHGRDALHVAAVRNHAQCAEILLEEFQMLPDRFCKNGFSPVHEAARRASFDTMLVLTRWAARTGRSLMQNPDSEGNLPLHLAVHSGDVKVSIRNSYHSDSEKYRLFFNCFLAVKFLMFVEFKCALTAMPLFAMLCFLRIDSIPVFATQGVKMSIDDDCYAPYL